MEPFKLSDDDANAINAFRNGRGALVKAGDVFPSVWTGSSESSTDGKDSVQIDHYTVFCVGHEWHASRAKA